MEPYYEHAGITIYHADCVEWLAQAQVSVDTMVTDPPYSSGTRQEAGRSGSTSGGRATATAWLSSTDHDWFSHDSMTTWGMTWFLRGVLLRAMPLLDEGAHVYMCSDWKQTPNLYGLLESVGFRVNHCLVWKKPYFGMGTYWRNQHENIVFASKGKPSAMVARNLGSVIDATAPPRAARLHPTQKPVSLMTTLLSASHGQAVLDPFMGSGTTLVAAKLLGRKAIGIEIEERYCEIAATRLSQEVMAL